MILLQPNNLKSGRLFVTTAADPNPNKFPALISGAQNSFTCQRCQMTNSRQVYWLPSHVYYCPHCIGLGRLTSQDWLVAYPEVNAFAPVAKPLAWQGTLTSAQRQVAGELCQVWRQQGEHLVWAVTGSGKTEMLFPMLQQAVLHRDRIALAAPRIDVCTELYPRIQAAFPRVSCGLLYGSGQLKYQYTQILVCTVHQLLKFRQAFDVLVLDECDSFPYLNNPMLHAAVKQAVKPHHTLIYLSATPSLEYQQRIQQQQLNYSLLNRRFHGHDLPVPRYQTVGFGKTITTNWTLQQHLKKLVQQQQRFLLFVPSIASSEKISRQLTYILPTLSQNFVHAKDPQRVAKVAAFRRGHWQALITTTVLERGVSFDDIDVIVWQADNERFNMQTLVQIAGRAGRSAQYSNNQVTFYGRKYTRAIQQAITTIIELNHG